MQKCFPMSLSVEPCSYPAALQPRGGPSTPGEAPAKDPCPHRMPKPEREPRHPPATLRISTKQHKPTPSFYQHRRQRRGGWASCEGHRYRWLRSRTSRKFPVLHPTAKSTLLHFTAHRTPRLGDIKVKSNFGCSRPAHRLQEEFYYQRSL